MRYDVRNFLDIEYDDELILKINGELDELSDIEVTFYTLDILKEMDPEEVNKIFNIYNVSDEAIFRYLFNELFSRMIGETNDYDEDSIEYKNAIKEVDKLNEEIRFRNKDYIERKEKLEVLLSLLENIQAIILSKNIPFLDEIDNLRMLIEKSFLNDDEKILLSVNLVKYLINKNEELNKKSSDDLDGFEEQLDEVYATIGNEDSNYKVYTNIVSIYYKKYKELFVAAGLGDTLSEVVEFSSDLSNGVSDSAKSIAKDQFCVEVVALLDYLNTLCKNEEENVNEIANVKMKLDILDNLYNIDTSLEGIKIKFIKEIVNDLKIITMLSEFPSFVDKISGKLYALKRELENNLITNERMDEIAVEYCQIQLEMEKILNDFKHIKSVLELKKKISELLIRGSFVPQENGDDFYSGLTNLQANVHAFIEEIKKNENIVNLEEKVMLLEKEFEKYVDNKELEKTKIKGFVLFDYDKSNVPYVLSDLDLQNKKNHIDSSIENNKLITAFEQYSSLVSELFMYGAPLAFTDHSSIAYHEKLIDFVYHDIDLRNRPTKMVRIRPYRSSLVRFVTRNFTLVPGTPIYKQVTDIVEEVMPNITIDKNEEFVMYINFASSLKKSSGDAYSSAKIRYARESAIHQVFKNMLEKKCLTDEECGILREAMILSLEALYNLEKKNEYIDFKLDSVIGGKKNRG